ncbi:MAG: hypothetical protein JNG88_17470 [Phycisphaerales bacterium]|nr:hypothetical protein [Phycisphaerales bacterium]
MALLLTIACIAAAVAVVLRSAAISAGQSGVMLDKYEELLAESREVRLRQLRAQEELEASEQRTGPHR